MSRQSRALGQGGGVKGTTRGQRWFVKIVITENSIGTNLRSSSELTKASPPPTATASGEYYVNNYIKLRLLTRAPELN